MSRWLRLDLDCLRAVGLFCIFMLLFAVAGCATPERQDKTSYSVTDAEGTDVPILHKPQRILTIGASSDEMMLGLVEPERMAAINVSLANTEDSNIPWVRERISNIISRNPSVEEIAALQPDLVAVPEWLPKENVDAIRELNIPVVVFKSAATIGDIHENIRLFAAAVGEPERGEILIEKMEEKLAQIRKKIALVPEEKKYKSIALISIMPNYGGVGVDGHLAFNEPGSSLTSRTRRMPLTHDTRVVNSRFFDNDFEKVPRFSLTVGVGTVMDARQVMVLINGHGKAGALRDAVEGPVTQMRTVSALQMHEDAIIVCDEAATDELKVGTYKYFKDIERA